MVTLLKSSTPTSTARFVKFESSKYWKNLRIIEVDRLDAKFQICFHQAGVARDIWGLGSICYDLHDAPTHTLFSDFSQQIRSLPFAERRQKWAEAYLDAGALVNWIQDRVQALEVKEFQPILNRMFKIYVKERASALDLLQDAAFKNSLNEANLKQHGVDSQLDWVASPDFDHLPQGVRYMPKACREHSHGACIDHDIVHESRD